MKKVYIETLGCPRNQVDSEVVAGTLSEGGYLILESPNGADFIIVNTCGFIEDAINESVDSILSLSEFKEKGECKFLIVIGCLTQRFKKDFAKEMPEVDYFMGTGGYFMLPEILKNLVKKRGDNLFFPDPDSCEIQTSLTPKVLSTYPYSFLKIAEGCARRCTFCVIPDLRGPLRSRAKSDLLIESKNLIDAGAREIVLVSQETTDYGRDLKGDTSLALLLDDISKLSKDVWIRFMYGHPLSVDDKLIDIVNKRDNICSYFDIPLQHASDEVLKRMGRGYGAEFAKDLYLKIRKRVDGAVLRTTLITGFPGESEDDFNKLSDFMEDLRFDHAGVFVYSEMDDIASSRFKEKVDIETAQKRQMLLMEKQALISQERNSEYLGKTLSVLIEKKDSEEFYSGRTMFQAPEVDGITYVDGKGLKPGDIIDVNITDAFDYDLAGNA